MNDNENDLVYPTVLPPRIGDGPLPRTLDGWDLTAEECAKYRKQLEFILQVSRGEWRGRA